ncbi:glycosyltransferase family 4 protein [Vibrio sp. B1Z05]|uniref:glycosyltransferase family 4 protein n=1 Tax=Vibrio sp. B1Z05 TaxID=2654980 RepID=UPI00128D7173|nr:glycosyltransferase family 4 protein [Vibrio sp. B1Z05]MPW36447.1 glycosyltransferase [Vibrio sp. B1Z05]
MPPTTQVLFVHYGDHWIRGSEMCLLNLIATLSSRFTAVVWTNNSVMHSKLQSKNIITYYSEFSLIDLQQRTFSLSKWFGQYQTATHILAQHNIGLIHVNSGAACQWMTLAAKIHNTPLLCQIHSPYNLHDRFTLTLHCAQQLIAVSHAVAKPLLNEGYPNSQLAVVHNGIPNTRLSQNIDIRQRLNIAQGAKVLISVGSLIHRKGFDKLIQALASLNNTPDEYHLIIIGEGSERLNLIAQTKRLHLLNNVHFVGEQSNVDEWLSGGCDLFVSGARSEAFGLVLVEASLAGLAVVAPHVGGIAEVIKDKVNGLLYQNGHNEIKALTQAIKTLIDDPSLRHTLANNGRQIAKAHFSLQTNTDNIESIYQQLLNKPSLTWLDLMKGLLRPLKTLFHTRVMRPIQQQLRGHYDA